MSEALTAALDQFRGDPRFAEHIVVWRRFPARVTQPAPIPDALHAEVRSALTSAGIEQLYLHQARAISAALARQDIVVVTSAASGKTLCYNAVVLDAMLRREGSSALYLFPTKALAQDQLANWRSFSRAYLPEGTACTYDGDTPAATRSRIRRGSRLLMTNPDMLHMGILPHHTRWQKLLSGLEYIVIDEMHAYRGIFGSHVANVLRRLRRICHLYGSDPKFICASATIGNPGELAQRLTGARMLVVDEDGSPSGERHVVLYNPPLVDRLHGIRRSLTLEAAAVADLFLRRDIPTITFCQSRLATELVLKYLQGGNEGDNKTERFVRGYRGGYLPAERRGIEQGLRQGTVSGVVSTNALELGVDIGQISACVIAGYPGTIASTWQQAGRAGRRQSASVTILIGGGSALDQYLLAHPEYLFGQSPERALLAPDNPHILRAHLKCAAFELPIGQEEAFASETPTEPLLLEIEEQDGVLRKSGQRWWWMSSAYPAQGVSLRTAGEGDFVVATAEGDTVAKVDSASAPMLIHPGAVYLHDGVSYLVKTLDWEGRVARVDRAEVPYFTECAHATSVDVLEERAQESLGRVSRSHGLAKLHSKVTSFRKIAFGTHELLATVSLNLPEVTMDTTAYWLHLHDELVNEIRDLGDWTIAPIRSYGPNWQQQRNKARARDGYKCQNCGRPERPGQEHDVHHLRPFRLFDYRPGKNANYLLANQLSNLITLCTDCHPKVEAVHAVQGTLEGLAHMMGALAPLHLMCAAQDVRVTVDLDFRHTHAPTIVICDAAPGGVGLAEELYRLHGLLLTDCRKWVRSCACEEGCPACVGPPPEIGSGAKSRVMRLLDKILETGQDKPN